ncbi:MAG: Ig-like domain-containing protein [Lachnospiraceae bacterium]|jgi:ribosomal protein S8E|nr:Ig-like domain-containing protein [Lachnospiraceae bacterium]MCI1657069.1 Ig-like domain-containing protein [Lachnospiraceae bacterium]MCI2195506.1 Ig-like domain-containing protein [Lachnospiraceae bacterium]
MERRFGKIRKAGIVFLCAGVVVAAGVPVSTVHAQEAAAGQKMAVTRAASGKTARTLTPKKQYLVPKMTCTLKLSGVKAAKVKWSSSSKKVATVSKKGKVKALRYGRATIRAKYKGKTYKAQIIVVSKKKATDIFAKEVGKAIKKQYPNDLDRLLAASDFVVSSFSYGNYYTAEDLFVHGKGTCAAGAKMVEKIVKSMGYPAKTRFAAKDKKSRYPSNVIFASQHYNVQVNVKGKTYYIDGTPGSGAVYLSTSKKPLFCMVMGYVTMDEIHK